MTFLLHFISILLILLYYILINFILFSTINLNITLQFKRLFNFVEVCVNIIICDLFSSLFWQKETKLEKETIKDYAHSTHRSAQEIKYKAEFEVPDSFGEVGAISVENEHHREMFIKDIVLDGFLLRPVKFTCESWIHSKYDNPVKRVFFSNKVSSPPLFIIFQ